MNTAHGTTTNDYIRKNFVTKLIIIVSIRDYHYFIHIRFYCFNNSVNYFFTSYLQQPFVFFHPTVLPTRKNYPCYFFCAHFGFVKRSLTIANNKTVARIFFKIGFFILVAPKYAPMNPPASEIAIQSIAEDSKLTPFETNPINPDIEFTQIKSAETVAVSFMFPQWSSNNIGLRIIPPPIPIIPDKSPIPNPISKAAVLLICFISPFSEPKTPNSLS